MSFYGSSVRSDKVNNSSFYWIVFILLLTVPAMISFINMTPELLFTAHANLPEGYTAQNEISIGELGDLYGFTNAMFSGFAMVGVILAIFLQTNELRAQRQQLRDNQDEMQATRDEIRQQVRAAELQLETMERQQFESTFFRLLDEFRRSIETFEFGGSKGLYKKGYRAFDIFHYRMIINENYKGSQDIRAVSIVYSDLKVEAIGQVDVMLNSFENLILFYLGSQYTKEKHYIHTASAILTQQIKFVLFYAINCSESFTPESEKLIIQFMLSGLRDGLEMNKEHWKWMDGE
ncbi:hypothetical protein [uncultured Rubinisphaera sp.]|uniref:hypothetical protein n=1 Tax=uncultured Rubinisphaera sp. TaxID=1678686 RepID=UPI0030D85A95|tara:strand:- start:584 stop:1456 length:873 start_codon:yes stop_codon:yes gene_type:complete